MIRRIEPLEHRKDFDRLTDLLLRCLKGETLKFLSYTLLAPDRKTIENLTEKHRENGIDYLIWEENHVFAGVLAIKKNRFTGFELFLLTVDETFRNRGIGQHLVAECLRTAETEQFRSIDSFVFADNKNMLRLLLRNDFLPVDLQFHARADGTDLVKMKRYL